MTTQRAPAAAGVLLTLLALTACSGGDGESLDSTTEAPAAAAAERGGDAESARDQAGFTTADGETLRTGALSASGSAPEPPGVRTPAVISTGTLTVESEDVAEARFDLGKVVDALGGTIADEKTTATSEGEVRLSRLVLRIPSEDFDRAMTDLAALGEVTASTRKAEDVTTEVIDTEVRIRAQEQSLERVEVLLARARSIRDIVAIEAQLTRRQAQLDSLKSQLAWLEDQTSLSTITVYLEVAPEPPPAAQQEEQHSAFVSGLLAGWDAMTTLGAGLAKVAGALLPFAVAALILLPPLAFVARRWLVRHPMRRPATEG